MPHLGIDYGRLAGSNRDSKTGIHYGVISQHSVEQAWYDSAEPDYGPASCPKCGNAAADYDHDKHSAFESPRGRFYSADYACESCELAIDADQAFGDEAQAWNYNDDGYELTDCLDSDIMILKAPFYTFAQFCSPCVPGAGNLDNAMPDGAKTYCLGHDWFEEGKAPYPVYSVETGALVVAP